jgi:Raf kinase inhibitor-like YbhB/YbcL family protein
MQIKSTSFVDGQTIPTTFTCSGSGVSPVLVISDVPENAKSLVLIMHDPDAVSGDFIHWLVWNIDPKTKVINEDEIPTGATVGANCLGKTGYVAPCPPRGSGTHRYIFELLALDSTLQLPKDATCKLVRYHIKNHLIEETSITGMVSALD